MNSITETWPGVADKICSVLSDDKKFIAGDKMTTYDYAVGVNLLNALENTNQPDDIRQFWCGIKHSSPMRLQKYVSDIQAELMPYLAMRSTAKFPY